MNGSSLPDVVSREEVTTETCLVVTIQENVNEEGKNPTNIEEIWKYATGDVEKKKTETTGTYAQVSNLGNMILEASTTTAQEKAKGEGISGEVLEAIIEVKTGDQETIKKNATLFESGKGTQEDPYIISCLEQFMAISQMFDAGYKYFEIDPTSAKWSYIDADGNPHMDGSKWPYRGESNAVKLNGSIDCKGLVIDNLKNTLFAQVGTFAENDSVSISNLTINAQINIKNGDYGAPYAGYGNAAVIRDAYVHELILNNITVHGIIQGGNHTAAFVGYGPGNKQNVSTGWNCYFNNCLSDAEVVGTGEAGGFIGHTYQSSSSSTSYIYMNNSDYYGHMTSPVGNGGYIEGYSGNAGAGTTSNVVINNNYNGVQFNPIGRPSSVVNGETSKVQYTYSWTKYATLSAITNTNNVFTVSKDSSAASAGAYIKISYDTLENNQSGMLLNIDQIECTLNNNTFSYTPTHVNVSKTTSDATTYKVEDCKAINHVWVIIEQYDSNGRSIGTSSIEVTSSFLNN